MSLDHFQAEELFCALMARRLAGELRPGDLASLEHLFQLFPGLQLKADLLEEMFAQEKTLPPSQDAREAYIRHWLRYRDELLQGDEAPVQDQSLDITTVPDLPAELPETAPAKPLRAWGQWTVLGAVVGLLGLFVLAYLVNNSGSETVQVGTPAVAAKQVSVQYGRKGQVVLPDGSKVWLNAGSTLRYDSASFQTSGRHVELSGEAYFDIAHDARRPFIVQSGQVRIRVLGTVFNVRAYPEDPDVETSLIRGSVEVTLEDRPDDKYILRPHEKLVVSNGTAGAVQQLAGLDSQAEIRVPLVSVRRITVADSGKLIHETAWVDNKLVFRSEDFSALAARMERHFGVRIRFDNPERQSLNFTGIFTTETIGQALEAMRLVHPFEYSLDNENVLIK
jgi:ferric-dicitrate binding protein FerR (iron transport regulator)